MDNVCTLPSAIVTPRPLNGPNETPLEMLERIGLEAGLNERQWIAYRIAGHTFLNQLASSFHTKPQPLRMMMTGPGGTGKTYVVRTLARLMSAFNCGHLIRFLAPTGSAVALIDGMTVHTGFGINFKSTKNTHHKGNSMTVRINIRNREGLRCEWKHVQFVLIDEVSMVSQQLLAEIDHALRYAKENKDEYFGGVNMIFAGDFCQFPPVGGSPLYSPIYSHTRQTNKEIS
jgi:hypothetical protein